MRPISRTKEFIRQLCAPANMDTPTTSPETTQAAETFAQEHPVLNSLIKGDAVLVQGGSTPGKSLSLDAIEELPSLPEGVTVEPISEAQSPVQGIDIEQEFTLEGMDNLPPEERERLTNELRAKVAEMQQSGHGLQIDGNGQVGFNPTTFGRVNPNARDQNKARAMDAQQLLALAAGLGMAGLTPRTRDGLILPDWMTREGKAPPRQTPKSLADRQAELRQKQDIERHNAAISAQRDVERQQAKELRKARKQIKKQAKAMGRA